VKDLSSFAMLLLKSSGGGGASDAAGRMTLDDDDDDDCSSDMVLPATTSTPSRGIRNFFRKRHKSVTIGSGSVNCQLRSRTFRRRFGVVFFQVFLQGHDCPL